MDLHLLENIICIADERSITRAAEKRFVTQSALNQQLQKLEEELGAALFIRSRNNWQLTDAGEVYLSAARKMILIKKDAYRQIADYTETGARSLSVGLIPERGVEMFTAVYPDFHKRYPNTRLEPVECNVTAMQRMISEGRLDLGLATLTQEQQDSNAYIKLAEEEIILAVPADHPLSEGGKHDWRHSKITNLIQFSEAPFVRIYRRSTLHGLTESLFQHAGFQPKELFSTSSNLSKLRMVSLGLCCALLPAVYAEPLNSVVYFRLPGYPSWQITMCSRKGSVIGQTERFYIDLCRQYWEKRENYPRKGE